MTSNYFNFKALLIAACVLGLVAYVAGVPLLERLVEAAYQGSSVDYLDRLVAKDRLKDPGNRTLAYYQERGGRTFERLLLVYFATLGLAAIARFRARRQLVSFFGATSSPLNLAVFRIVLFGQLLLFSSTLTAKFGQLSEAPLVPPPGWGWLLQILPPTPDLVEAVTMLFRLCCLAGLVGLFTRSAAIGAAITGLYAMGVLQFFGKIDHYHHLWWFTLLLAFSPAGHVLSIDGARRALPIPQGAEPEARQYALPLRFIWLLIGLVYFFPGLWKFVLSGTDWALSDNLKFKMYAKWFELGGWEPFFRLDQYPWLYRTGGILTLVFELGFIFALFSPRARVPFILGGLVFFVSNGLFLNIYFTHLAVTYAAFFDWHRFFRWLGGRLFRRQAVLHYEPGTPGQRRAALVRSLDFFGAIQYQAATNGILSKPIHLTLEGSPVQGVGFWTVLMTRVPLVLLALPFLVAPSRRPSSHPQVDVPPSSVSLRPITRAGLLLLIANCICGLALIDSWPFAVYPTFASVDKPQAASMILVAVDVEEQLVARTVPLHSNHFKAAFGSPVRLRAYLNKLLSSDPEKNSDGFKTLWLLWRQTEEDFKGASTVHFYQAMFSTIPEDQYRVYRNRRLLFSLAVDDS